MKQILFLLSFILLLACTETKPKVSPLDVVLQKQHPAIQKVMEDPKGYEVQIIYTQIDKDANGKAIFTDYTFQLDAENYFYPASSVKLPAAILALEYMDKTSGAFATDLYTTSRDTLKHSIANDVHQIFAVSDNEAYNRLYELLGRDAMNKSMRSKGLSARLSHRLATDDPANAQRDTLFFGNGKQIGGGLDVAIESISAKNLSKGKGYIKNDSLISEAMDFSEKNYFPLETQHNTMKRIFFEENFSEAERFQLSATSKELLKTAMHTVPRKVGYDEGEFYDSYGKFFIYGNGRGRIQDHIKIYNKVGYAYGYITDTALITDERKDVSFLLSATMLVNENGIFNDDVYEYGSVGLEFLTELGRGLYHYELDRKKQE